MNHKYALLLSLCALALLVGPIASAPIARVTLHVLFAAATAFALVNAQTTAVPDSGTPSIRSLAVITPVAVLTQIALGAAYRGESLGLMPHAAAAMFVAFLVLIASIFVLTQFPNHPNLKRPATGLLGIALIQVILGIAAYLSRISTVESSSSLVARAHVAAGALTMALSTLLSLEIFRNVTPPAPEQNR